MYVAFFLPFWIVLTLEKDYGKHIVPIQYIRKPDTSWSSHIIVFPHLWYIVLLRFKPSPCPLFDMDIYLELFLHVSFQFYCAFQK